MRSRRTAAPAIGDGNVSQVNQITTPLQRARELALGAAAEVSAEPTSEIEFRSSGRLLIIVESEVGPTADDGTAAAHALIQRLTGSQLRWAVLSRGELPPNAVPGVPTLSARGRPIRLAGHLGAFQITVVSESGELNVAEAVERGNDGFDLIADLSAQPLVDLAMPPLGYFAENPTVSANLDRVADGLRDMVGEFTKPRYFNYDPSICAHGNSGLQGCRQCLDACPAGAIVSLVERIEVDPYACQGGGACATSCPTGAITYAYPRPRDMLNRLRVLIATYRDNAAKGPSLLFHDVGPGREALDALGGTAMDAWVPIEVEEVASVGMDLWLACLAYGASRVDLLTTTALPSSSLTTLSHQVDIAEAVLTGLGYPAGLIAMKSPQQLVASERSAAILDIPCAGFMGSNQKRDTLFSALDHLVANSGGTPSVLALPGGAPFGEVRVDRSACTLCMACVSVCPASALSDGRDQPLLGFLERNCVQCGLCESACPESAIQASPRLLTDRAERNAVRILNEEAPFNCVACGKPFATRSVVERMTQKLAGHHMFQDERAIRRLQMCGDCRVIDMMQD